MSTFTINIKTDNAAFRNEDGSLYAFGVRETVLEAMRKLIDRCDGIEPGSLTEVRLFDHNGNRVGEMTIDEDIPETVTVCSDCMSADCGGDRGRLLIDITREQYEARPNVCQYCDRVNCDSCEED